MLVPLRDNTDVRAMLLAAEPRFEKLRALILWTLGDVGREVAQNPSQGECR